MLNKLLFMISTSLFIQFANAQGRQLDLVNGILIYWSESKEVPMYVLFIPTAINPDESFDKLLTRTLSGRKTQAYLIYFQPVRWTQPRIGEIISSLKFAEAKYGSDYKQVKISSIKIAFDKTYSGDPEVEEDSSVTEVKLFYKDHEFILNVSEWPRVMGTPKDVENRPTD
jgi:hypothetical protein